MWTQNYIYYTCVRCVWYLLPYVSLRENHQKSESSLRFLFEDFHVIIMSITAPGMFIQTFFGLFCCYLSARLFRKFTFNSRKKKARGEWSGIEEIGVRALAQLRVLCSDRARSFYQWPARVISELFLKDDTFVWVAVFSEFCLQPATAVNVFECPSTSFIDQKVVEQRL